MAQTAAQLVHGATCKSARALPRGAAALKRSSLPTQAQARHCGAPIHPRSCATPRTHLRPQDLPAPPPLPAAVHSPQTRCCRGTLVTVFVSSQRRQQDHGVTYCHYVQKKVVDHEAVDSRTLKGCWHLVTAAVTTRCQLAASTPSHIAPRTVRIRTQGAATASRGAARIGFPP